MPADYVDISSNNGTPNLAAYRDAGHTDLMLKATEGTGYAWAQMRELANAWHSYGLRYRVGYFHWLYGTESGSSQASFFLGHVLPVFRRIDQHGADGRELGDWFMTDFEDVDPSRWVSDAQHLAVLRDFDGTLAAHGWVDDYAPDWYLANLPQCVAWLKGNRRPVVASDYSNNPPGNRHGLNHVIHQYTDRASVPGMATPVDMNRYLAGGSESADSGGAIEITGEAMSSPEYTAIMAQLSKLEAAVANVQDQNHRTGIGITADFINLKADIRDSFLAASGQNATLPDGTKITNLTAVWHLINTGQLTIEQALKAGSPAPASGVTADQITAAAEAGASKALDGATVTIHGGNA